MPKLPECPACSESRIHSDEEWKLHPGEGRTGMDWNIPLKPVEPKPESKQ